MKITHLKIKDIRTEGMQTRAMMDMRVIEEYAEAMRENPDALPPVTVYQNGQVCWLADGFHRLEAAKSLKRKERQPKNAQEII